MDAAHRSLTAHPQMLAPPLPEGDLWIFAYGSLMWNPAFEYLEHCSARLYGYHRSLCVLSHVHRGTPEHPGMVLGLDRGGSCQGRAFKVRARDKKEITAYLYAREIATLVYRAELHPIKIETPSHGAAEKPSALCFPALCFIVDRKHHQYAGKIPPERCAQHINDARGISGTSRDYLASTLSHLQQLDIHDARLLQINSELQHLTINKP